MIKATEAIYLLILGSAPAIACDCTVYPFDPNPPCFSQCTSHLSLHSDIDLSSVKNLDPNVAKAISTIRKSNRRGEIDFWSIDNKEKLEAAAQKAEVDKPGAWKN